MCGYNKMILFQLINCLMDSIQANAENSEHSKIVLS